MLLHRGVLGVIFCGIYVLYFSRIHTALLTFIFLKLSVYARTHACIHTSTHFIIILWFLQLSTVKRLGFMICGCAFA